MGNLMKTSVAALLMGLGIAASAAPLAAQAQVTVVISVGFAPPLLPIYDQPRIPGYGYIWTPGYWAWDDYIGDYYWVPGTWVRPPRVGYLWTPAYWGWSRGRYVFYNGYWGPRIGFYGGINYGYGYYGNGYDGGYWRGDQFYYNRYVNNISNVRIPYVYNRTVARRNFDNRVSYVGGAGGVQARATNQQLDVLRESRIGPTSTQQQHRQAAAKDRGLRASVNRGAPPIAATAQPGRFRDGGVVAARPSSATYRPPAATAKQRPSTGPGAGPSAQPQKQQAGPQQQARPQPHAQPQKQPQARPQQQAHPQQPHAQAQQKPRPQQQQAQPQKQQKERQQDRPDKGH